MMICLISKKSRSFEFCFEVLFFFHFDASAKSVVESSEIFPKKN